MSKCILHIGAGKCGSSSLQQSLSSSGDITLPNSKGMYFSITGNGDLVCGYELREIAARNVFGYVSFPDAHALENMSEGDFRKASKKIKGLEGYQLIASSEGHMYDHAKFRTGGYLSKLGLECDVIMYVRPPVDWINSAWWQWGAWTGVDFETWVKHVTHQTYWAEIAKEWESVPGVNSVEIRILRSDVVGDFAKRYGVSGLKPGFHNASLSGSILRFLQLHKDLRPNAHASQIDFILPKYIQADSRDTPWVVGQELAEDIMAASAPVNQSMLNYMDEENKAAFKGDERWRSSAPYQDKVVEPAHALDKKDIAGDLDKIAYEAILHIIEMEKSSRSL